MAKILALWSGDLALDEAFWTWTVTVGLLINIATSILFLEIPTKSDTFSALMSDAVSELKPDSVPR